MSQPSTELRRERERGEEHGIWCPSRPVPLGLHFPVLLPDNTNISRRISIPPTPTWLFPPIASFAFWSFPCHTARRPHLIAGAVAFLLPAPPQPSSERPRQTRARNARALPLSRVPLRFPLPFPFPRLKPQGEIPRARPCLLDRTIPAAPFRRWLSRCGQSPPAAVPFCFLITLAWRRSQGDLARAAGQGTNETGASGMPGGEDVRKVSRQDIQLVSAPRDPSRPPLPSCFLLAFRVFFLLYVYLVT
jgi:hypothetical protein